MERCCKDRTEQINEQDKEIDSQYNKIKDLQTRLENQKHFSRRNRDRFHNIPVLVDWQGKIQQPVNTDLVVLTLHMKE